MWLDYTKVWWLQQDELFQVLQIFLLVVWKSNCRVMMTCQPVHQFSFTPFYSYSHFHTNSSLGCVLFTDEDYLPPKEADDVDLPETDLEELLEPPCPRCATVSYLACHRLTVGV